MAPLQFSPWASSVDVALWAELARLKLDALRLSERPLALAAHAAPGARLLQVSSGALGTAATAAAAAGASGSSGDGGVEADPSACPSNRFPAPGVLVNVNTLEAFKEFDRTALVKGAAGRLWDDITSGAAERAPWLLGRFAMLAHADLKKWRFYHWLAAPCFALEHPAQLLASRAVEEASDCGVDAAALADAVAEWRAAHTEAMRDGADGGGLGACGLIRGEDGSWARVSLAEAGEALRDGNDASNGRLLVAAFDPCEEPGVASWPVRNLLTLAGARWAPEGGSARMRLLCVREARGRMCAATSLVMDLEVPHVPTDGPMPRLGRAWERNAKGKAAPRVADLGAIMDPVRLAEQAADLNLKLMRWRVLPELDTEALQRTRCLLLGAGTLGCAVARGLLAWGVRHVTLTDCARVSYSNPVRQSLYNFEDCKNGGRPKAEAAAEALSKIFPGARPCAHELYIPMPGHDVGETGGAEANAALASAAKLRNLIEEHDAVFVLTDTRESRWLPTLLCSAMGRPMFNTALGFDSYVVMRHGVAAGCAQRSAPSGDDAAQRNAALASSAGRAMADGTTRLGCYFCNDVVAPLDSTKYRTLDQQCTVTRPGLAPIAGALAVEMLVAMVHHPEGAAAPASGGASGLAAEERDARSPLGALPHQLRGFLGSLQQLPVAGAAYDCCTACSDKVVAAYQAAPEEFLLRAFNEPAYLEELTGLAELQRQATEIDCDWDAESGSGSGDDW